MYFNQTWKDLDENLFSIWEIMLVNTFFLDVYGI